MPGTEVDAQHHLWGAASHSDDLSNYERLEERHDRIQREPDTGAFGGPNAVRGLSLERRAI
jgi:hypothetical protein